MASVLIGLSFLGFGTQTVRADVTNTASDTAKTEQAESNQQNAATEEPKADTTTSDDNAVKADQQKVAVKENDNSITKAADADKDVAKTVVDNKATETKNEKTPAVDNISDANKNATETTKPATSTTPVNDTDAKTPAKEGDVGKTEPGETTKDASKPATTDQGNLLKKQQLLILIRSKMVQ